MDKIVSNATPLIYLAKADKLMLLKTIVKEVFIPETVFREVVVEGNLNSDGIFQANTILVKCPSKYVPEE